METELVSPAVAEAAAATMAQLAARRASAAVEQNGGDGLLVETLVRQAVEPMLRDWLDVHLQGIVERLVRREVERIARRAELG
jgi:cell pole-organizing protein PopZ